MSLSPERFFVAQALPLGRAIHEGDIDAVRRLAPVTDLRARCNEGMTFAHYALHEALACEPERLAVLTALVAADPGCVQVAAPDVGTVLENALGATTPAFLVALLDAGVSPRVTVGDTGTPALLFAPRDACIENLRALLDLGESVDARDLRGSTALIRALYARQLDAAEYLLARGADPRAVDRAGVSFLYVLTSMAERAGDDDPLQPRMAAIASRYRWDGAPWPPDAPEVERDRLRARGVTPIVPAGLAR
jgi:ankyrin repeat protein